MGNNNRELVWRIFRHNPYDSESVPRLQEYRLQETARMTLFTGLTRIREEIDPSLQFDFVCRSAICGSCAILVNGRPRLACRTRTQELPRTSTLLPLPFFQLVADLSVDTGAWFRQVGTRVGSWVHETAPFEPDAREQRMSESEAQLIYELDRCIECGCCVAACAAAQFNPDYLGAAGILRIARFLADPRDRRTAAEVFEVIGTEDGVFGCIGLLACADYCPKGLPLASQLAHIRRRMTMTGLRRRSAAAPS